MSAIGSLPSFENLRARIAILSVLTCHEGGAMLSWWHRTLPAHLAYLGSTG